MKKDSDPGSPSSAAPAGARRLVLRFLGVFTAIMAAFYVVWVLPPVREDLFPHYLHWNAAASAFVLRLLGHAAQASGEFLRTPEFSLQVGRGCDAVQPTMLFLAALIALPAARRRKVQGALAGTALLLGLNLIRIVSLFLIGLYRPNLFHLMHVDVWQSVFIFVALLLWLLWALWAFRPAASAPAASTEREA
jgi:exosortase H (IPTLxxWG-CTERM-specific)